MLPKDSNLYLIGHHYCFLSYECIFLANPFYHSTLFYLIFYPFSPCRFFPNKDDCNGLSIELVINPFLYRSIAIFPQALPVIVRDRFIAFNNAHASNLRSPPIVGLVMKTVERSTSHSHPHCLNFFCNFGVSHPKGYLIKTALFLCITPKETAIVLKF